MKWVWSRQEICSWWGDENHHEAWRLNDHWSACRFPVRLSLANSCSSSNRRLKKSVAVWYPGIVAEICALSLRNAANNCWCISAQRLMNPLLVVVFPKGLKFPLQVVRIPKKDVIQVFTTNRSNQSLNKWMWYWCMRDGLNFFDFKNFQVGLPSVIKKQHVVVWTEVVWSALTSNGCVEHTA